jgi:hypothetical protein
LVYARGHTDYFFFFFVQTGYSLKTFRSSNIQHGPVRAPFDYHLLQLSHVGVLFPEGRFTSSSICRKVETWLRVKPTKNTRSFLQQHEINDPFFALYIWALLTNRLTIAVVLLCKRPGEIRS